LRRGSNKKSHGFALIAEKLDWRKSRGYDIFSVGEKPGWDKTGQEIERVKRELSGGKLSRRLLLNLLRGLGIGFGAAFLLGVKPSGATGAVEGAATLRSTNPALNKIIEEASSGTGIDAVPKAERPAVQQVAAYLRLGHASYRRLGRAVVCAWRNKPAPWTAFLRTVAPTRQPFLARLFIEPDAVRASSTPSHEPVY
jgi:hypothetical protein